MIRPVLLILKGLREKNPASTPLAPRRLLPILSLDAFFPLCQERHDFIFVSAISRATHAQERPKPVAPVGGETNGGTL